MGEVVGRLRGFGLTKAESLQVLNLGVGLESTLKAPETEATTGVGDGNGVSAGEAVGEGEAKEERDVVPTSDTVVEVEGDDGGEEDGHSAHRSLLGCIVEGMDERFADEEGEEKIKGILNLLRGLVQERSCP